MPTKRQRSDRSTPVAAAALQSWRLTGRKRKSRRRSGEVFFMWRLHQALTTTTATTTTLKTRAPCHLQLRVGGSSPAAETGGENAGYKEWVRSG